MTKTKDDMANFFKEAFAVDGYVRFHSPDNFKRKLNIGSIVELNDSKKGKFYILMAEGRDETVLSQLADKVGHEKPELRKSM